MLNAALLYNLRMPNIDEALRHPRLRDCDNLLGSYIANKMLKQDKEVGTLSFADGPRENRIRAYRRFMRNELTEFEHALAAYLNHAVADAGSRDPLRYFIGASSLYNAIASASSLPRNEEELAQQQNSILTFNYTYPFRERERYFPGLMSINPIHEVLSSDPVRAEIIIGIDVVKQYRNGKRELVNDEEIVTFTKTYRTLQSTTQHGMKSDIFGQGTLDCIKFFGHSLTEADYSYFQSIFDHVDLLW